MKRNPDLIKRILTSVEAAMPGHVIQASDFPDVENAVLTEHVRLLEDAGLVQCAIKTAPSPPAPKDTFSVVIYRLTWRGHEYLCGRGPAQGIGLPPVDG